MFLNDCADHPGLFSAIGACSDESKAVLSKAFSYLGIAYSGAQRNSEDNATFALSLRDKTAVIGTEQIEFDSQTRSWHRILRAEFTQNEAARSSPTPVAQSVSSADNETQDAYSPWLSKGVCEDWTTLLPATDHVDFLKSREWHKTGLGPMLEWPQSLKLMTMKMLDDPRPANLYWGPTRIAIYNEPFSIIAAGRHPAMMGSTAEEAMPVTYPFLSKVFDEIEKTGVAFSMPEFEMSVEKVTGFVEEAWYDGVFSPIRDTDGAFLGLYNSGYDVTVRKMAQRNIDIIHKIAAGPLAPETSSWQHVVQVCSKFENDVPFLVLYSVDDQEPVQSDRVTLRYQGSLGIETGHPALPERLDLNQGNEGFTPILRAAKARESSVTLNIPNGKLPDFLSKGVNWRGHGDSCTHVMASPLFVTGLVTGFLIIGLNPRRQADEAHMQFVEDITRVTSGLLAFGISVSQAKQREKQLTNELTQRQKFLQRIAEIATVGLYSLNVDGLLTWANPMYFDITGVTQNSEERYNNHGVKYIFDDDQEKMEEGLHRCFETKLVCTLEVRLKKTWRPLESEHDEPCWIMTTLAPNVENDEIVDVIGCVTDVSHLKWAEKTQMEMAEAAKLAKQRQERFIDFTSHEMRNPLGAIIQCADDITMVAETQQNLHERHGGSHLAEAFQTILENANSISFCANHQNRIVDDILTVSKLDSAMLTVTPVVMNARTVVFQTMQAHANRLVADDIKFRLEVQAGYTDLQIACTYGDPTRITQILVNLITNAIKFTRQAHRRELCVRTNALKQRPLLSDPGNPVQWFPSEVQLAKYLDSPTPDCADDPLYLMFEVEDTGNGISKEEMKGLFNRFAQASPKTHITYGGSGLGLFISRELVELQGGMIGVSSQPGHGSVFAFYIETRRVESTEDTKPPPEQTTWYESSQKSKKEKTRSSTWDGDGGIKNSASPHFNLSTRPKPLSSLSILFVEDNLINQKVLGKQLERMGCTVHVANHGAEALELIKKSTYWKDNQVGSIRIDVVLMDWEMPVMDGVTCTRQIREMEAAGSITKHLLIVGATANARPEQVEVAMSAGMDDLITKPFTVAALMKRIGCLSP